MHEGGGTGDFLLLFLEGNRVGNYVQGAVVRFAEGAVLQHLIIQGDGIAVADCLPGIAPMGYTVFHRLVFQDQKAAAEGLLFPGGGLDVISRVVEAGILQVHGAVLVPDLGALLVQVEILLGFVILDGGDLHADFPV